MTTIEILKSLNVGTATLTKFEISIQTMNAQCGYFSHGRVKGGSTFERSIRDILDKHFHSVESHVRFVDCQSPRGFPLEFDFLIDGEFLIEADGIQHTRKDSLLYDPYLAQCDEIKNVWCAKSGIKLVRIKYRPVITEKYVLKHLIESQANHNVAGNGKREGSKNCLDMDNQQPSRENVLQLVSRKVQRLTGEDTQTNKPDTNARRINNAMI